MNENLLSVRNASGRHVSLLNYADEDSKRKYRCCEPGCKKRFTTSGHLARHNRIHTGEKNFPCLFPGCQSRFSRQDNMMQHYRTHMSPKSRRYPKKTTEDVRPKPHLHAHQRIRSDTIRIEPPLTIDQHLSNYHSILRSSSPTLSICSDNDLFYQHRPLTYSTQHSRLPFTLLHPNQPQRHRTSWFEVHQEDVDTSSEKSDHELLQLAQIVSTFG